MSERTYFAGCYWGTRNDSADLCAQRAETLFRELARIDPLFTRWYQKAGSRKKALQLEFEPTASTWLKMFPRNRNKYSPHAYHVGVWNGRDDDAAAGVSFQCGETDEFARGRCVVNMPYDARFHTVGYLSEILRQMVLVWDPLWGVATSDDVQMLITRPEYDYDPGWITYVPRSRGPVPPLPAPMRVEPVEDKGTLIVLTPERLSPSNPAHVELNARLRDLLTDAGLIKLRPPPA